MARTTSATNRMAAAAGSRDGREVEGRTAVQTKPARVTLNLPPSMMRDIERWAVDKAGELEVSRVSIQVAMRAMLQAALTDDAADKAATERVRQEVK